MPADPTEAARRRATKRDPLACVICGADSEGHGASPRPRGTTMVPVCRACMKNGRLERWRNGEDQTQEQRDDD